VRGIGKTTIEKAVIYANEQRITFYEVLSRAGEFGFKGAALEAINNFVTMIRYFQSLLGDKNAYEVAVQVGKHTNIVKEMFSDKTTEGVARYENIQELLNSIKEWTVSMNPTNERTLDVSENESRFAGLSLPVDMETGELIQGDTSLAAYLQQIALLTDADEKDKGNANAVKMMTIHSAKALEFSVVFVGGAEETIFPSGLSINTREELEEERRLFYVAVTRAKHKLWLSYANARYRFGNLVQNEPSRFLDELPAEHIDKSYAGGGARNQTDLRGAGSAFARMHRGFGGDEYDDVRNAERQYGPPPKKESKPSYLQQPTAPKVVEHKPSKDFVESDTSNLQAGQRVEHQKFGFGTVTKVEGSKQNPIATVLFEKNGEKKIMLNYAKLRIIQ
jgi:DNA helicase-2/ATP-dependent DNA helicase PcrA